MRPPRYYDKQYEKTDAEILEFLKKKRTENANKSEQIFNKTLDKYQTLMCNRQERLDVKEKIKLSRLKLLTRPLEKI